MIYGQHLTIVVARLLKKRQDIEGIIERIPEGQNNLINTMFQK